MSTTIDQARERLQKAQARTARPAEELAAAQAEVERLEVEAAEAAQRAQGDRDRAFLNSPRSATSDDAVQARRTVESSSPSELWAAIQLWADTLATGQAEVLVRAEVANRVQAGTGNQSIPAELMIGSGLVSSAIEQAFALYIARRRNELVAALSASVLAHDPTSGPDAA